MDIDYGKLKAAGVEKARIKGGKAAQQLSSAWICSSPTTKKF
jgi:hypothetical protein